MIYFLLRLLITAVVVVATAHVIPDLEIKNLPDTILFGLIVGIVNAVIRPIIVILTIPITVFTLGLFLLVVNAFTFWLASLISLGVQITAWEGAFWGGLIVWLTGILVNRFIWEDFQ
ncbi:MAG: phage holin family protein [Simkaniaceae bacterium]|nr:phage holin family protein [Simkaniaceae bacterium]